VIAKQRRTIAKIHEANTVMKRRHTEGACAVANIDGNEVELYKTGSGALVKLKIHFKNYNC